MNYLVNDPTTVYKYVGKRSRNDFEGEEEGRPINLKLENAQRIIYHKEFDLAKHQEKLAKAKETLARIR
jgi:hypothetical protein